MQQPSFNSPNCMRRPKYIIAIFLVVDLCACSHYYYIPNIQNVPLFNEKNELHATLLGGGGREISTTEFQLAYAMTNNMAIMTNLMYAKGGELSSKNWGKGNYYEGAFGYYKPLFDFCVVECYLGYGNSNQHHHFSTSVDDARNTELSFTKFFVQPDIGISFRGLEFALSARMSRVLFYNIKNYATDYYKSEIDAIADNKLSYLFEPAITIRFGWKNLKFQFQSTSTKNLSHSTLRFEESNVSLGVHVTIGRREKKRISEY